MSYLLFAVAVFVTVLCSTRTEAAAPSWCSYLQLAASMTVNSGSNAVASCCSAFGECDGSTLTRLTKWSLGGTLPNDLATHLPNMTHIELGSLALTGTLPSSWGNLRKLQSLFLRNNLLRGTIPSIAWELMGVDLASGQSLSIVLRENQLEGTLPTHLPKRIGVLDVAANGYLGGTLPSNYSQYQIAGLYVAKTNLSGTLPAEYAAWKNTMEHLQLGDSQMRLNQEAPEWLFAFAKLKGIKLDNIGLQGTISPRWGTFSDLEVFSMRANDLTGTLPIELSRCKRLSFFDVSYNKINGTIPPEYGREWSVNQYFYASDSFLTGDLPPVFSSPMLLEIDVSYNFLNGTLPSQWSNATTLTSIGLYHNQVRGSIPESWRNLTALSDLTLNDNAIAGVLPQWAPPAAPSTALALTQGMSLRRVFLSSNDLEGSIPVTWATQLQRLVILDVSNNPRLNGSIPSRLGGPLRDPVTLQRLPANLSIYAHRNRLWQPCDDTTEWNLLVLGLSYNDLPSFPDCLYGQSIRELDLAGNWIVNVDWKRLRDTNVIENLNLAANVINGPLPRRQELWSALTSLNVGSNALEGNTSDLTQLTQLCSLTVSDNLLNGSFSKSVITTLLSSIVQLDVSANAWTSPSGEELDIPLLAPGRLAACANIAGGAFRSYNFRSLRAFAGLSQEDPPAGITFLSPHIALETRPAEFWYEFPPVKTASCSALCRPTDTFFAEPIAWSHQRQTVTNLSLAVYSAKSKFNNGAACNCEAYVTLLANGIRATVTLTPDPPIPELGDPISQPLDMSMSGVFFLNDVAFPLRYDVAYRLRAEVYVILEKNFVDNYSLFPRAPQVYAFSNTFTRSACPVDTFLAIPGTLACISCPEKGICNGTSTMVTRQASWRPNASFVTYKPCYLMGCRSSSSDNELRQGWECAEGYHGPLCDSCRPGYSLLGKVCIPCFPSEFYNWCVTILVMLGTIVYNVVMIILECRSQSGKLAAQKGDDDYEDESLSGVGANSTKVLLPPPVREGGRGDVVDVALQLNAAPSAHSACDDVTVLKDCSSVCSAVDEAPPTLDETDDNPVGEGGKPMAIAASALTSPISSLSKKNSLRYRVPGSAADEDPRTTAQLDNGEPVFVRRASAGRIVEATPVETDKTEEPAPAVSKELRKRILLCLKMLQNHMAILSFFLSSPLNTELMTLTALDVGWFQSFVTVSTQVTTLDQMQVFLGCAISAGPIGRMYFVAPQVGVMIVAALLLVLGARFIKPIGITNLTVSHVLRVTVTILLLSTSLAIVSAGSLPLACDVQTFFTAPPESRSVRYRALLSDRTTDCDSPAFAAPLAVGWLLNIFAIGIVPLGLAGIFYRTQREIGLDATLSQYEFMTGNFLPRFWYWELLIFTRKNVCLLFSALVVNRLGLVGSLIAVMFVFLQAHFLATPYSDNIYNQYDAVSLTSCGLLGCLMILGTVVEGMAVPAFVLVALVTFLSILPMLLVIGWSLALALRRLKDQTNEAGGDASMDAALAAVGAAAATGAAS